MKMENERALLRQIEKDLEYCKENYIMKSSLHIPYAFVDIDGQWLDENDFDSYDEYCQHFIDTMHNPDLQDWWYVIVDCHF